MIDEYQFYEAKAIGADAVLLIVAILDDAKLKDFYQLSRELGLGVLTETHDEYEIERALNTDSRIIGINNRNLKDFSISIENTGRLKKYIPDDRLCIAESGIMNDDDVAYLKEVGVDGERLGEIELLVNGGRRTAEVDAAGRRAKHAEDAFDER